MSTSSCPPAVRSVRTARFVLTLSVVLLSVVLSPPGAWAQDAQSYTLTGRVVDAETNEALPGANVQIVDTSLGTVADADGTFSFSVTRPPGEILIRASFIGFRATTETVTLGDAADATVNVGTLTLSPDVLGVEELVVTGTGAPTERKRLGTSISTVDAQALEASPSASIDQALQGKIAGANIQQNSGNPAGGLSIRLRGTGTVLGDASPLFIVDGVIVNNDSPELIDLGGGAQNRLVDLNPNDVERIEVVKGAAAAALYGSRANDGVVQIFTKRGATGAPRVTFSSRVQTDAVRKTLDVNEATNDAGAFLGNDGEPLPDDRARFDWQDFIFDRAWGTEQYLSVSGGVDDTRYFVSGGHYASQGIVRGNTVRRLNGRARIDRTLYDWVSLSAGAQFSHTETEDVPNGGLAANYGALTGFIFGPNTFDPRPDEFGQYPNLGILANPVEVIEQFDFGQETRRFTGDIQLSLNPAPGLTVDYLTGVDTYEQVALAFIPPGTSASNQPEGYSRRSTQGNLQVNSDLNVRYETDVTDAVGSTTLVGGSMQYESTERFSAESQLLSPFIFVSQSGSSSRVFGETRLPFTLYGVFAQQTVDVADRLFLTGALRADASSSFGEGERWQLYPKGSLSYVVSDEPAFQRLGLDDLVSTWKIRGSVGVSGGLTSIDAFERFTSYGAQPYVGRPGYALPGQLGVEDVRPERQTEFEIGTDLALVSDRLALEFTYYNQKTRDLLLNRTLAPTSGFGNKLENVGTLTNRGIEILLRGIPVSQPRFRWASTVTFARNRNEVNGLEEDVLIFARSFGLVGAINGEPLGIYYGSSFARNDDGDVVDVNGNPLEEDDDGYWRLQEGAPQSEGDGIPANAGEERILGDPNPNFTASWINDVSFGDGWTVRTQIDAIVGQEVFNFTRRLGSFGPFGTLDDYERELEGDLPDGYNAAVFGIFENWVEDGSFVKLREVAVSYTLRPTRWPVRNVQFKASGRNLFSIDTYSGYDPEINVAGQSTTVRGFDFVEVPIPRSFSLGVTLGF